MSGRILIVEDDYEAQLVVASVLSDAFGIECDLASSISEAKHALDGLGHSLTTLVVDLRVPVAKGHGSKGLAGLALIDDLRGRPGGQDVPVIIVTEYVGRLGAGTNLQGKGPRVLIEKPEDLGRLDEDDDVRVQFVGRLVEAIRLSGENAGLRKEIATLRREGSGPRSGRDAPQPDHDRATPTVYSLVNSTLAIGTRGDSINQVGVSAEDLFNGLVETISGADIPPELRRDLTELVAEMKEARPGSKDIKSKYLKFIDVAADHVSLFNQLLPALTQLVF